MQQNLNTLIRGFAAAAGFAVLALIPQFSHAQGVPGVVFKSLYAFQGGPSDAGSSRGGLTVGADGNLYGTGIDGGPNNYGAVFVSTPSGAESVLHFMNGMSDGSDSHRAGLVLDSDGNFLGLNGTGGDATNTGGNGTLFQVTPDGNFSVISAFTDGGGQGLGTLIPNSSGSYYGLLGGYSTIEEVTESGALTPIYTFTTAQGGGPNNPLVIGPDGNLYGTTYNGGKNNTGTIFQVTPSGSYKLLYSFTQAYDNNPNHKSYFINMDGQNPMTGLVVGPDGQLYGSTPNGGVNDEGTLFKITTAGKFTLLYANGNSNGDSGAYAEPMILGSDGNLYGTGTVDTSNSGGTVFQLTSSGVCTILHTFQPIAASSPYVNVDGAVPESPLVESSGILYGVTSLAGPYTEGTLFSLIVPSLKGISLGLSPTRLVGGNSTTGTVTIPTAAPSGGSVIKLTSSNTSVASVPTSVVIPAGDVSATFNATSTAVSSYSPVKIKATYNSASVTQTLDVTQGSDLSSIALSPNESMGGVTTTMNQVALQSNATADTVVTLTSTNPSIASISSSVTVKAGTSSQTFPITFEKTTSQQKAFVTATLNGVSQVAQIIVDKYQASIRSINLSPETVQGGTTTTANRVYITNSDASASVINFYTSNPSLTEVPRQITIAQGVSSHAFTIETKPVTKTTYVTISATYGSSSTSAATETLTLTP